MSIRLYESEDIEIRKFCVEITGGDVDRAKEIYEWIVALDDQPQKTATEVRRTNA